MRKCECGNDVADNARTCPKCGHRFTSGSVRFLTWFIVVAAACVVIGLMLSNDSPTPAPAPVAPAPTGAQKSAEANASATAQGDQAAKLISQCGKPDRDFTKNEGGQPIRHMIYKKKNVELMYSRQGIPAWALVGIFKANADENMDTEEANRRLPCAKGNIRTVLDRP